MPDYAECGKCEIVPSEVLVIRADCAEHSIAGFENVNSADPQIAARSGVANILCFELHGRRGSEPCPRCVVAAAAAVRAAVR